MDIFLQILATLGACLVLLAYWTQQRGIFLPTHRLYLSMNLVGASLMTFVAIHDRRLGFILLEGIWALVSLYGLIRISWQRRR